MKHSGEPDIIIRGAFVVGRPRKRRLILCSICSAYLTRSAVLYEGVNSSLFTRSLGSTVVMVQSSHFSRKQRQFFPQIFRSCLWFLVLGKTHSVVGCEVSVEIRHYVVLGN